MKIIDSGNDYWETRQEEFDYTAELISNRDGLNLEFGVFEGYSINNLSKKLPDLHFYGFDSFEGLPEDWKHGTKDRSIGHFSLGGKPPIVNKNVTLIKGFFDKTLDPFLKRQSLLKMNFLHIDSDLYSSAKYILNTLSENRVDMKQCVIRFDDFCDWRLRYGIEDRRKPRMPYTNWRNGEYKAFQEWVREYNISYQTLARNWDKSFYVMID